VARAKRTDRAEARRRYRAQLIEASETADTPEPELDGRPEPAKRTSAQPPTAGPRRGMGQAFQEAFRPLDLRGDIAALPRLLRSRAGWLPILLVIAATAVAIGIGTVNVVGNLAFYWFISPFPMAPAFVIGFLAPRASYLLGLPVGLLGAGATALILALTPGGTSSPDAQSYVAYTFLMSPPFTAFFAAAAAWYKRFLALINPNRARRGSADRSGGKAASRRSAVARR
jgi:hypothetical protein